MWTGSATLVQLLDLSLYNTLIRESDGYWDGERGLVVYSLRRDEQMNGCCQE